MIDENGKFIDKYTIGRGTLNEYFEPSSYQDLMSQSNNLNDLDNKIK